MVSDAKSRSEIESSRKPRHDDNSPSVVQPISSMPGQALLIASSNSRCSKSIPAKTRPAWGGSALQGCFALLADLGKGRKGVNVLAVARYGNEHLISPREL